MIVFDLKCEHGHQFESWFRSSSAYEEQKQAGLIACPYCDSSSVSKALMAPNVSAKGNQTRVVATAQAVEEVSAVPAATKSTSTALPMSPEAKQLAREAAKLLAKLQKHVEATCDNVGDQFAEEARKIHYGEADERGIYGNATLDEAQELVEEGIDLMPLPIPRRPDA